MTIADLEGRSLDSMTIPELDVVLKAAKTEVAKATVLRVIHSKAISPEFLDDRGIVYSGDL